MTREEYMKQLAFLLQDIPEGERTEALAYYEDYFAEAGEGNEQSVVDTLGSPEKVAALIKDGLAGGHGDTAEYTDAGFRDERFSEFKEVPQPKTGFNRENRAEDWPPQKEQKTKMGVGKIILVVVLLLLAIELIGSLVGGVFGIAGGLFELIFGLLGGTIAAFVSGGGLIIAGIGTLGSSMAGAFLMIGVGLLALMIAMFLLLLWLNIIFKFIPWAVRSVVSLITRKTKKGGSAA